MRPVDVLQEKSVTEACEKVLSMIDEYDRIIIFGSFYTVSDAMQFFDKVNNNGLEPVS